MPEGLEQTCHTNFDDCGSVPCQNEAECFDHVHSYSCVCAFGWDGENCDHSINPCSRSELRDCDDASRSLCEHVGPGMHTCTCRTGWECADPPPAGQCSGRICTDIDECASNPCQNDAACTESFVNTAVSLDSYRCSCIEGFTGGSCTYEVIPQFAVTCDIAEGGNCDTDVYECVSDPCQNGGICTESATNNTNVTISFHAYSCACQPGYANGVCPYDFIEEYRTRCSVAEGGNCDVDVNECDSNPCQNGATCDDSLTAPSEIAAHAYRCTCVAGWQGFNCADDIDECLSHPCANGAPCVESSTNETVSVHAYSCLCVPGFTNGLCQYTFISEYFANCSLAEDRECDVDVDECSSYPCQNDGNCLESTTESSVGYHSYTCLCKPGWAGYNCADDIDECVSSPCQNGAVCVDSHNDTCTTTCTTGYRLHEFQLDHERCITTCAIDIDVYRCLCPAGYANGQCDYEAISEYVEACNVSHSRSSNGSFSGNCDVDVDECISAPCANRARCTESIVDATVSAHSYRCDCTAGYANGRCTYDYIDEYTPHCTVMESESFPEYSGNCNVDVNECDSSPCRSGSVCSDSTSDAVPLHAYKCDCLAGFANGWCEYDFIDEYTDRCQVHHSLNNSVFNGNCDIDVDECDSSPCENSAVCTDSRSENVSVHSFRCSCAPGFANGLCLYGFIQEYNEECSVEESSVSQLWNGTCSVDVVECASAPCLNGATCTESTDGTGIAAHAYSCACTAGWEGENCQIDTDECASLPCQNAAECTESSSNRK